MMPMRMLLPEVFAGIPHQILTNGNNKTTDGSGPGTFTSSLTGLTPNTTYYIRAYATTSTGTLMEMTGS